MPLDHSSMLVRALNSSLFLALLRLCMTFGVCDAIVWGHYLSNPLSKGIHPRQAVLCLAQGANAGGR